MVFRVWIWINVRKSSLGEFFSVEPSCKLRGWRKLQRTCFNECSVTTHAEQIGSARSSAVFLRILIQRISSTQQKKFKKGVTFKIYENITFCPSFQLSEFKRCRCRTWQINLQVRNNPSVCSGAEPPSAQRYQSVMGAGPLWLHGRTCSPILCLVTDLHWPQTGEG